MTPYEKIMRDKRAELDSPTAGTFPDDVVAEIDRRIEKASPHSWVVVELISLKNWITGEALKTTAPEKLGPTPSDIQREMDRIKQEFGYVNQSALGAWVKEQMKMKTETQQTEPKSAHMDPEKRALIKAAIKASERIRGANNHVYIAGELEPLRILLEPYRIPGSPGHTAVFGIRTVQDLIDRLTEMEPKMEVQSRIPNEKVDPTVDTQRNRVFL